MLVFFENLIDAVDDIYEKLIDALDDGFEELIDALDDVSVSDVSTGVDWTGEVVASDVTDFSTQEEGVTHYHFTCRGQTRALVDEVAFFFIISECDEALHPPHAHVWVGFEVSGPLVYLGP